MFAKARGHVADFSRGGRRVVRDQLGAPFSPDVEGVLKCRFSDPWVNFVRCNIEVLNLAGHVHRNTLALHAQTPNSSCCHASHMFTRSALERQSESAVEVSNSL